MTKRRLASYGLNLVGAALLYALITLAFTFNAFGKSTTYIQGICTTACYTIIMVTSLNLVVGFMGEFSMGHAGFASVGAYVSAIVSGALAGHGLSDLALLLVAILAGGLAAGIMGVAVGIPALRLRGDYLAIVTMAFAEIIRVCFCNFSITGGGKTMSGILKLSTFDRAFWIMVVYAAASAAPCRPSARIISRPRPPVSTSPIIRFLPSPFRPSSQALAAAFTPIT